MDSKNPDNPAVLPLPVARRQQMRRIVPEFLARCRSQRIYEVRIVHGSHDARYRRTLHNLLRELPEVACFSTGSAHAGSPRATIVVLLGPDEYPVS